MAARVFAIANHSVMLGGGEHAFVDLLSRLPKHRGLTAAVPGSGELADRLGANGIDTRVMPLPPVRPWRILDMLRSLKTYVGVCRQLGPDVIYANGSRAAIYGGLAGKILGIPLVWHCRITEKDPFLDPILLRLSAMIVANSHATARRFHEKYRAAVCVVHNGVDIEWLTDPSVEMPDRIDAQWNILLMVARVSRWKRHDIVLSAFESIAQKHADAHLVCIGDKDPADPEWWDVLMKKTRQSAFSNRIHWMGPVADVRPWYRAASLLMLASDNEPFGRVLVEAMASRVPVVARRGGGVSEVVRDGEDGLLVDSDSSDAFAEAMDRLLDQKLLAERLIRSAFERSKMFSLDRHAEKMIRIFETFENIPPR